MSPRSKRKSKWTTGGALISRAEAALVTIDAITGPIQVAWEGLSVEWFLDEASAAGL
jgi:hypothetical protein